MMHGKDQPIYCRGNTSSYWFPHRKIVDWEQMFKHGSVTKLLPGSGCTVRANCLQTVSESPIAINTVKVSFQPTLRCTSRLFTQQEQELRSIPQGERAVEWGNTHNTQFNAVAASLGSCLLKRPSGKVQATVIGQLTGQCGRVWGSCLFFDWRVKKNEPVYSQLLK